MIQAALYGQYGQLTGGHTLLCRGLVRLPPRAPRPPLLRGAMAPQQPQEPLAQIASRDRLTASASLTPFSASLTAAFACSSVSTPRVTQKLGLGDVAPAHGGIRGDARIQPADLRRPLALLLGDARQLGCERLVGVGQQELELGDLVLLAGDALAGRRLTENDALNWPHCDGLKWPHLRPIVA
jgi:hypothetical protein